MTTLQQATRELHTRAERTPLMQCLIKGNMSRSMWADLLYTQYVIFGSIEDRVAFDVHELHRAQRAFSDWQALGCSLPKCCLPSLDTLALRLRSCDLEQIWAHVYVHYLALLYGGQIIRQRLPSDIPTTLFEFQDPEACKLYVRSHVDTHLAQEACDSFSLTIEYYNELYRFHQNNS
jgi:heme oxygenase